MTGLNVLMETFGAAQKFIEPYIMEHKSTLDSDNIRDFVDLMLLEIEKTDDKQSSFYGEIG